MFGKVKTSLLLNNEADSVFKVTASQNTDDVVLLTTLRALLYERNVELSVGLWVTGHTKYIKEDYLPRENNRLVVVQTTNASFEIAVKAMENVQGFERIQKITDFYASAFPAACWENAETKSTFVVLADTTVDAMHYACVGIPAYLPWYFQDGLKEWEAQLLKSLTLNRPQEWEKGIEEFLERTKINFKAIRTSRLLEGFEKVVFKKQLSVEENNLRAINDDVECYSRYIHQKLRERQNIEIKLIGLRAKMEEEQDNEIMDLFLTNDKLSIDYVNGTILEFFVSDYITLYDESYVRKCINNENSILYKSSQIRAEDMKSLYTALFLSRKLKLRTVAKFRLDISGYIEAMSGFPYPKELDNRYPNPHLYYYNCLGDYRSAINSAIINGDNVGAIMTCIASAQSMNFGDSAVMDKFVRDMYNSTTVCIETPDGELLTPKQAIVWLYDQQKTEGEETNE